MTRKRVRIQGPTGQSGQKPPATLDDMIGRIASVYEENTEDVAARLERFSSEFQGRQGHLKLERLVELGRSSNLDVSIREYEHLQDCERCGDYIASIRQLSNLPGVAELPVPMPSGGHILEARMEELRMPQTTPSMTEQSHLRACAECRDAINSRGAFAALVALLRQLSRARSAGARARRR